MMSSQYMDISMIKKIFSRSSLIYCFISFFIFAAHTHAAGVYKWTDEHGKVHYGDKPNDADNSAQVKIKSAPKVDTDLRAKQLERQKKYLNALELDRAAREEARAKKKEQRAKVAQAEQDCNRLRNELVDYQRGGIVYYKLDAQGNRQFLSEAEIKQDIVDLQQRIKAECR